MQLALRCHKKIPYVVLLIFKEQTVDAVTRMKSFTLQDLTFTLSQNDCIFILKQHGICPRKINHLK